MIRPLVYLVTPAGVVHVADDEGAERALCDARVSAGWMFGDETLSGHLASCEACGQAARVILRHPAVTVAERAQRPDAGRCGHCVAEVQHTAAEHATAVAAFDRHSKLGGI